jgi:hypothetical protein
MDDFQKCYCHPLGIHCVQTKKSSWNYGNFNWNPAIGQLIFDEFHRCGGLDSLNADMMIAARRQGIPILGLSATAAFTPLQFRAPGYALGLFDLKNFYNWTRRYGYGKIPGLPGWHWLAGQDRQNSFMQSLRKELFPAHGVRVSTRDIPGFPERTITADLFDLDEGGKVDALYKEMNAALEKLNKRIEGDLSLEHPLTQLLRTRQKIELLKVPMAVELARDFVSKGCSVGLFVNFSQTIEELRARMNCDCVIDGTVSASKRQANVEAFNGDRARAIIINSEAGGTGLSLPDRIGDFPRVGLVMLPSSARTLRQLVGRFNREDSRTPCFYKILLASGTLEEKHHKRLNMACQNLDTLNDGDLTLAPE